jgi:hypothetical protein
MLNAFQHRNSPGVPVGVGQLQENLDDLKAFMEVNSQEAPGLQEEPDQCLSHQQEDIVAHQEHMDTNQEPTCKTEAPKVHQIMKTQPLEAESQESMVTGEEQPQPQEQPSLTHTKVEKDALGFKSGNSSVSGEGCFLDVMAEDLGPEEGAQQLPGRQVILEDALLSMKPRGQC